MVRLPARTALAVDRPIAEAEYGYGYSMRMAGAGVKTGFYTGRRNAVEDRMPINDMHGGRRGCR